MLISKAPDEENIAEESTSQVEDDTHEYQTANELFELMGKNQNLVSCNDGGALTPRDLVLLYKNIDVGTKLIPNRRVETIVYSEEPDSEDSDISEIVNNEDLRNVISINNEQIDFLDSHSSVENKLCHKFGDFEIQTSVDCDYDKHFLFKDPYIKEQLNNFNLLSTSNEVQPSVLPTSLLDYVCCKRLEDNYNFYMDNIIRYVKNTIDQLKRISNGDYLTDRAKEKWREVEQVEDTTHNNTKVLATSTSIPLHVECKIGGLKSTWDDLVHSAVDVRSLSKILEKKIIVEIPKLINGSFTVMSKRCANNLIISCKQDYKRLEDSKKSRVDVLLQLKRSATGQVVSKISSIMILQSTPAVHEPHDKPAPLPLTFHKIDEVTPDGHENNEKFVELDTSAKEIYDVQESSVVDDDDDCYEDSDSFGYRHFDNHCNTSMNSSSQDDMTESSSTFNTHDSSKRHAQKEASFDVCPDDLRMTIKRLATQSALPEESIEEAALTVTKKKSPTRIRIKSPYENQSYILEEKKRRKLLEIRERRERKKMAMAESCKITKHRYGKGAVMPQASSSVTKLSITNKSFYNSIYGHVDTKAEVKQTNNRSRKRDFPEEGIQEPVDDLIIPQEKQDLSPTNAKKFINRSYYLDDTVSEMMYMKMKRQEKDNSGSTSAVSSDFRSNFNMFSPVLTSFECDLNILAEKPHPPATPKHLLIGPSDSEAIQQNHTKELTASQSILNIAPANSPKTLNTVDVDKKVIPSLECRKSIDKIYQLVKKLGKNQSPRTKPQSIFSTNASTAVHRRPIFLEASDSGTSLRPNISPSNPSSFTFSKNSTDATNIVDKKPASPTTVTKVIISSKSQIPVPKSENSKNKERKRVTVPSNKVQDGNPLKAISQLLHEFDNVQRKRIKSGTEQKSLKKSDASNDSKSISTNKKRSRLEQHNDYIDRSSNRITTSRDKRTKPLAGLEGLKIPYQQVPVDDKTIDKSGKKRIMEILDEAKEARGEAVRGPSKFNSRLNSLAQPKKTYVQAHSEEYQNRYGRNLITDRLQRLAATPTPLIPDKGTRTINSRNKIKRSGNEAEYTTPLKQPVTSGFPIERPVKPKRSRTNSPIPKERSLNGGGPVYIHVPIEKPEALKKKMVAVESYVKNHYGRNSQESHIPQKSRVPLLPDDIALRPSSTLLESSEAGNNLHRMIESMMTTNTSHGLDVLTECLETNSRSSRDNTDDVFNTPRCDEGISIDSDYTSGTDDGILATGTDDDAKTQELTNLEESDVKDHHVQPLDTTFQKRSLCSHLSLGTFSKHLRINSFTATPKSSIQKLFILQSGDAGSLMVKTSVSQTDKLLNLKRMPVLSKTHWNLQFPTMPMQITTVGYAFPEYNSNIPKQSAPSQSLKEVTINTNKATLVCHNGVNKSLSVDESYENRQRGQSKKPKTKKQLTGLGQVAQNDVSPTTTPNTITETAYHSNKDTSKCISIQTITDDQQTKINSIETKVTQTVENRCTSDHSTKIPDIVDYTTSLDILVGLLNEIQKITTCQTHITNNEPDDCKELEMLLNKAAALDNSIESSHYNNVSITSLDKLRCLDSNPSLYSFYISDTEETNKMENKNANVDPWYETKNNAFHTTVYVDKEVNVNIAEKEYVNTLTDVPSAFFPITISHSTNMTNTLVEEFCQSSIQSLLSFTDYKATYSTALCSVKSNPDDASKNVIELLPQIKHNNVANKMSESHNQMSESHNRMSESHNQMSESHQENNATNETKLQKRKPKTLVKHTSAKQNLIIPKTEYCLKTTDFDPIMKFKRDILVTVYSMLVLTVFAALSFPEVMYHVM